MKKFISIATILLMTLSVYSCRETEELINNPEMDIVNDLAASGSFQKEIEDSLKIPDDNEPDPPIRDGQDWRIGFNKKKN